MTSQSLSLLGLKQLSVHLVDCLKTPAVLRPEAGTSTPGRFRLPEPIFLQRSLMFHQKFLFYQ